MTLDLFMRVNGDLIKRMEKASGKLRKVTLMMVSLNSMNFTGEVLLEMNMVIFTKVNLDTVLSMERVPSLLLTKSHAKAFGGTTPC